MQLPTHESTHSAHTNLLCTQLPAVYTFNRSPHTYHRAHTNPRCQHLPTGHTLTRGANTYPQFAHLPTMHTLTGSAHSYTQCTHLPTVHTLTCGSSTYPQSQLSQSSNLSSPVDCPHTSQYVGSSSSGTSVRDESATAIFS